MMRGAVWASLVACIFLYAAAWMRFDLALCSLGLMFFGAVFGLVSTIERRDNRTVYDIIRKFERL